MWLTLVLALDFEAHKVSVVLMEIENAIVKVRTPMWESFYKDDAVGAESLEGAIANGLWWQKRFKWVLERVCDEPVATDPMFG